MFFIEILLINICAGFLSALPFFILLEVLARKQIPYISLKHLVGDGIFGIYLAVVLAIAGVPGFYQLEWNANTNLIPLSNFTANVRQYVENVLLFLPIGLLLPSLYGRHQTFKRCMLPGFCFSLSIELIQLFSFRSTDVNDLLMNTLGCAAGYGIFALIHKLYPAVASEFTAFPEEGDWEAFLAVHQNPAVSATAKQSGTTCKRSALQAILGFKEKLLRLFDAEAVIFFAAAWIGALLLMPLFKSAIWRIFLQ